MNAYISVPKVGVLQKFSGTKIVIILENGSKCDIMLYCSNTYQDRLRKAMKGSHCFSSCGACGRAFHGGTMLQTQRWQAGILMRSEFSIDLSFQQYYGPGLNQPLTEISTRNIPGWVKDG
jgi:hypothetical protein